MIKEKIFVRINEYLKKRKWVGKEIVANDTILFDTHALISGDELYKNGKRYAKDILNPKFGYCLNTHDFLNGWLKGRLNLTFCIAPITESEIKNLWVANGQERRIAADAAIHGINNFKRTLELSPLGQKEQLSRFKILEPALTFLLKISEYDDYAVLYECGVRKIDWILTGDEKHFNKKEVLECLNKLSIGVLNPKEIDGIITKELEKMGYENGKENDKENVAMFLKDDHQVREIMGGNEDD